MLLRRHEVCTMSLDWRIEVGETPVPPEPEESLIPPIPEPPRLAYERPRPKESSLRGPRGVAVSMADARSMGQGWEIASALVSSLIAGILLGLAADRWWIKSTTPWGVIVGFLLGCVSGFGNLFKLAARQEAQPERRDRR